MQTLQVHYSLDGRMYVTGSIDGSMKVSSYGAVVEMSHVYEKLYLQSSVNKTGGHFCMII